MSFLKYIQTKNLDEEFSSLSEDTDNTLDEEFQNFLSEGVHDKAIFKAVFLGGGPGSGKDRILSKTLDGHGLVEINSDKALEYLMDREGLNKKMPETETEKRNILRMKAKHTTEIKHRLALKGRNGLIINGTADNPEKVKAIKDRLEELGYNTSMLMVHTKDEISRQRNVERGQRGGRTVPEVVRKSKWDAVHSAKKHYKKLFGDNYLEFDNSYDAKTAHPDVVDKKEYELSKIHKHVQKFVAEPPKHPNAHFWISNQLQQKDTYKPDPTKRYLPADTKSKAHQQAQKSGLQYYGMGRYGKNNTVTHRAVFDKLVTVSKPLKESYELSGSDARQILELGIQTNTQEVETLNTEILNKDIEKIFEEDDHLKHDTGEIRYYTLRASAAKDAHQKNGIVLRHKTGKYFVKLNKGKQNVRISEENIQQQSGSERVGILREDTSSTQGRDSETFCEETSTKKTAVSKKITIAEIRSRQKEKVIESIDKGIEPGVSMSGSGESVARDTGEKIKKRTGKASQVTEMTGDETTASIGDQKEDELKKKGISLTSFKKRNFV